MIEPDLSDSLESLRMFMDFQGFEIRTPKSKEVMIITEDEDKMTWFRDNKEEATRKYVKEVKKHK